MFGMLFNLLSLFGNSPWLERYLKLGINPTVFNGLETIITSLGKTKDVSTALNKIKSDKELEIEFQRALLLAENEYWQMCLRDRQDARERDLALHRMQGRNRRANFMLIMAIFGIMSSLCILLFFKAFLTSDVIGIISAIAAVFGSCLKDAYSFEFGSSNKPSNKSAQITLTDEEIRERMKEIEEILNSDFIVHPSSTRERAKKPKK